MSLLSLIDASIFAALGFGIYRYSRLCAVLALLLYGIEQYYSLMHPKPTNTIVFVFFFVFFLRGIRGTFAYHKLKNKGAAAGTIA
jgi:hypothetical protein